MSIYAIKYLQPIAAMTITRFSRYLAACIKLAAAGSVLLALSVAEAQAAPETSQFKITRNGKPIGTHIIEVNRNGNEISVSTVTDLTVKILFVTAYRLQISANERWDNGRLIALNATSNNNGKRHSVSATAKGSSLEIKVDGQAPVLTDPNIVPNSFWNPELLGRPIMLDMQDGQIMPLSVRDGGDEELTINERTIKTRHYTVISRYSQDLWYDDNARLVQARLVASDGSTIVYRLP